MSSIYMEIKFIFRHLRKNLPSAEPCQYTAITDPVWIVSVVAERCRVTHSSALDDSYYMLW